jgi:protoheme IX farnesyltransferase
MQNFLLWNPLKFQAYKELSKSNIVLLVLFTTSCGYLIGYHPEKPFYLAHFFWTLVGVGCSAAGSCALNQIQEIKQDSLMRRTQARPLPSKRLSLPEAFVFSLLTLLGGLGLLSRLDLRLASLTLLTIFAYNGLYTTWWKRIHPFAAIPGALPGALPVLIGFFSSSGQLLNPQGIYLFSVLFFWQMPHFWALALRYQTDYQTAGFPTLPVKKGRELTLHAITLWCLAFMGLMSLSPFFFSLHLATIAGITLVNGLLGIQLGRYMRNSELPKAWIQFFLSVNFSMIFFFLLLVIDLTLDHLWFQSLKIWLQIKAV